MKLRDLLHERKTKPEQKGTFIGVKISTSSRHAVMDVIEDIKVPNPIGTNEMHMTVIYSKTHIDGLKPRGKLDEPFTITPKEFHIFPAQDGSTNALVVKMNAPELEARHKEIMDDHPKATYDFDEYIPHLTLSYDCGDFDPNTHDATELFEPMEVDEEYHEELNLNWAEENT